MTTHFVPDVATAQTPGDEPALRCECRAWRRGLLSDHRDWRGEMKRAREAGRIPDETVIKPIGPVAS